MVKIKNGCRNNLIKTIKDICFNELLSTLLYKLIPMANKAVGVAAKDSNSRNWKINPYIWISKIKNIKPIKTAESIGFCNKFLIIVKISTKKLLCFELVAKKEVKQAQLHWL